MTNEEIAKVCHEANKAYCEVIGDFSQKSWLEAEQWQRDSAISGVDYAIKNPFATPEDQHGNWVAEKEAEGWKHGVVKDDVKKEHPCMVPYSELPLPQRRKDALFRAIVKVFS